MRQFVKLRMLTTSVLVIFIWMVVMRGGPTVYQAISSALAPTSEDWTESLKSAALFGSAKFVHTFTSTQDEILFIYQKYMLTDWIHRPDLVEAHRTEVFHASKSTAIDEFTLTQKNTNSATSLPFYSPFLPEDSRTYSPQLDLLEHLPKKPVIPSGTLFKTCSVVGNGGLLLDSGCGREIDKADFIFRCNMVPIKRFAADAGVKTNFTTMNPSIVATRYNKFRTDDDKLAFLKDLEEFRGQLFLPCLFDRKIVNICTSEILPVVSDGIKGDRLAVTVGNPKHLLGIMKPWNPAGIHFMSSGFYLAQTALTMCKEVRLFGFWPFTKTVYPVPRTLKNHFFDDRKQTKVHKFSAEFQILWQLHKEGILKLHTRDCNRDCWRPDDSVGVAKLGMLSYRGISLVAALLVELAYLVNARQTRSSDVVEAEAFLQYYDKLAAQTWPGFVQKIWNYNYNMTEFTRQEMVEARLQYSEFSKQGRINASRFNTTNFPANITRQLLKIIVNVGENAFQNKDKLQELKDLKVQMKTRYSNAKACNGPRSTAGSCMPFTPDAENLMASSRDYTELLHLWKSWRDANGPSTRPNFARYVALSNLAANDNDQPDKGAMWRSWYEVDNLEEQVDNIYKQLRPLYANLHAYIRRKLYDVYGPDFINLRGPIPAHLLGHMWASEWANLLNIAKPYPEKQAIDITSILVAKGYTVRRMVEVADEFYTSMGLFPVPDVFYNKSRLTRPKDGRPVICHGMAWDFYDQKDFRISMCADVNMDDFLTVHHELGHVQYFNQFRELPIVFRLPPCPAFGEAIGDVVAISAFTPQHLYAIGLLDELIEDDEAELNFLMGMALEKIAFLPFSIIVDKWRWAVFNGSIPDDQYNTIWWQLRKQYQGITPPLRRDETDLDPASIYHVSADVSYTRYFLAYIVQFQLYQSLCRLSGHVGPLHKCDIYNSTQAGDVLSAVMRLGISKPWHEAMNVATGQRQFDGAALVEYFQPLTEWLVQQNQRSGDQPGWPDRDWMPRLPPGWSSGVSTVHDLSMSMLLCASITATIILCKSI
ncbi:angiotensin-converting enzyme-like protein Ace3 [Acanthaster planci]|uniref:Angiotensin-converting enzyme n=1 Tax=Acanthaster planci TaxID=133434 RepID=A0A8B7XHS6_ACAPL|nr:angiotensin-converting enzyme-like protein Ace3 [Acanthaster planci]